MNAADLFAATVFVFTLSTMSNTTVCALSILNIGGSPASFLSTADRRRGAEAY